MPAASNNRSSQRRSPKPASAASAHGPAEARSETRTKGAAQHTHGAQDARPRTAAAQARLDQIASAAVQIVNERGMTGLTLQAVAQRVGITQAGVIHYVGDKHGLLIEIIKHYYDRSSQAHDYIKLFEPGGVFEGGRPRIPEYCRLIVAENAHQPELVMLFQALNTESMSQDSPTHDYFAERSKSISESHDVTAWHVPDGVDGALAFSVAMAAMYGLEGRWLARPDEIDYEREWARFEDILFPLPLWEGYR